MSKSKKYNWVLFALLLSSCLEPYDPPGIQDAASFLVVDGFINSTDGTANVKLSRTTALSSDTPPPAVINATLTIEDNEGTSYLLNEEDQGNYLVTGLSLSSALNYRLYIQTSEGNEFVSDYISLLETPLIDSVTWKANGNGVTIAVNTHDPSGKTPYYLWNYTETWEYIASFYSTYKMVDGEAVYRELNDRIWMCWNTKPSTEILIGSTVALSQDRISDYQVTFIPGNAVKLSQMYSILIQQRALSKEAYDFWLQLKKSTESLGGLFDPLPAQVLGNIKSTNADEPVLGYFSGGQVSQERLFIPFEDLPDVLLRQRARSPCISPDDITEIGLAELPGTSNSTLLIDPIYVQGVGVVGYTSASAKCVDCRQQGGVTTRPDYWP